MPRKAPDMPLVTGKKKAKVGAPTKYKGAETIKKAKEYLEENTGQGWRDYPVLDTENNPVLKEDGEPEMVRKWEIRYPLVEELALHLGVSRRVLYDWADRYKEFLHILEECNDKQASTVLRGSMNGDFNAQISKLMLGKHGYKEMSETDDKGTRAQLEQLRSDLNNMTK